MSAADFDHPDLLIMRDLIGYTREHAVANDTFTGAFVVQNGGIVCRAVTSIVPDQNPLAHAEMKVMRQAIKQLGGNLTDCHIYTTQRPCPMCASAMIWSGISSVTYGLKTKGQWDQNIQPEAFLSTHGILCFGPVLENECKAIEALLPSEDEV
jgi:tRNA(Arg) A34 adenosine deaminase TadA